MRIWLGILFAGALASVAGGMLMWFFTRTPIAEIQVMLLVGFGALVMAMVGVGMVLEDRAAEQQALLRILVDRMPLPRI